MEFFGSQRQLFPVPKQKGGDVSYLVSEAELANTFGVTDRTIRNWVVAGLPRAASGLYDLRQAVPWKIAQAARKATKDEAADPTDEARRELYVAQRERIELEIAQRRAELLPAPFVERMLRTVEEIAARQIGNLADRCTATLAALDDPAAIQAFLFTEGRATRRQIAVEIQSMAEALEATE